MYKTKHRTAARAKHQMRDYSTFSNVIIRSQTLSQEEQRECLNPVLDSWDAIKQGRGTKHDVEQLTDALSVCMLASEGIDQAVVDICESAAASLVAMAERYVRVKKIGVDAKSLEFIPYALECYQDLLKLCKKAQLAGWMQHVLKIQGRIA